MLSEQENLSHRVVILMESPAERKWTTLRTIASARETSALEEVHSPAPGADADEVVEAPEALDIPEVPEEAGPLHVLVAHPVASTSRLIRETLENFTSCRVVSTPDPLRAFELALQRRYGLFFFGMIAGELSGPMLYELISKAYSSGHGPKLLAPGVIFIREKDDPKLPDSLNRDPRVKDVISKPIRIERLLEAVKGVLEVRDPTVGA